MNLQMKHIKYWGWLVGLPILLASCKVEWNPCGNNTNSPPTAPVWAVVRPWDLALAIEKYIYQLHPEIQRWVDNQPSTKRQHDHLSVGVDDGSDFLPSAFENQAIILREQLVSKCLAALKNVPKTPGEERIDKFRTRGYASGSSSGSSRDSEPPETFMKTIRERDCFKKAIKDNRYKRLMAKADEIREKKRRVAQYKSRITDISRQLAKKAVVSYAKGRFAIILSDQDKPIYTESTPRIDITKAVEKHLLDSNPKITVPPIPGTGK